MVGFTVAPALKSKYSGPPPMTSLPSIAGTPSGRVYATINASKEALALRRGVGIVVVRYSTCEVSLAVFGSMIHRGSFE